MSGALSAGILLHAHEQWLKNTGFQYRCRFPFQLPDLRPWLVELVALYGLMFQGAIALYRALIAHLPQPLQLCAAHIGDSCCGQ